MIHAHQHCTRQQQMALPLALLVLFCSMFMPPASSALYDVGPKEQQHCLAAPHAMLAVQQLLDYAPELNISEAAASLSVLPSLLFAHTWFALRCTEFTLAALQRSYMVVEQAIRLSVPSWMLIFPFNAFW